MLLISVEVSVKVTCRSTKATDCKYRAITMLLILVKVSVKLACRSTIARAQSYLHATYFGGSICVSGLPVQEDTDCSTDRGTYCGGTICVSGLPVQEDTDCSTELLILVEVSV